MIRSIFPSLSLAGLRVPLLVFALTLLVTGVLAGYLVRSIEQRDQEMFDSESNTTLDAVENRVSTAIALLRGTAGLFEASQRVDPDEFADYVKQLHLHERYPGIVGIGFGQRFAATEVRGGMTPLGQGLGPQLLVWPPGQRDEYQVVSYLEPFNPNNRMALGFDLSSEPVRRRAMGVARDSGNVVASSVVSLVHEASLSERAGFVLFRPLYRGKGEPLSIAERRERLYGFLFSPLRIDELFRGVRSHVARDVDVEIFDRGPDQELTLLYSTEDSPSASIPRRFVSEQQLAVGGRNWQVRISSRPQFDRLSQARWIPWIVSFALIASLGLAWISYLQVRGRRAAEIAEAAQRRAASELRRERERLQAMLVSIADGVIAVDHDERIVLMNSVAERLTGWDAADAQGRPLDDVVVAVAGEVDASLFDVDASAGNVHPLKGEITLTGRNGRRTWIEHHTAAIRDCNGVVDGAVIVLRDITEHRRAERALRVSEERERQRSERLQQLAAATPMLNSALTLDALCAALEAETVRLLEAPAARLCLHATNDEHAPTAGMVAMLGFREGQQYRLEVDPQPQTPYSHDDQALLQHLAGIAEIAMRNIGLYEELRANDRRKDEFLATLAHELRNPLAPISSSLEVLRLFPGGEHAARAREVAERQTRHMVRLIDDLLDLSRVSRGTIALQREPIPLAVAIESALETVAPLIRARQHRLQVGPLDDLLWVDGDAARLAQVFANLLGNAAKYTEPGGLITLTMQQFEDWAEISIVDSGVGIAKEDLSKVFDMFVQVDRSPGRAGGLGVGLTLVHRLVDMHGGTVEPRSAGSGQGCEFIVRLPLLEAPASYRASQRMAEVSPSGLSGYMC